MVNAQKIDRWTKWVERIEPDVIWLHHHRRVWREMILALGERVDAEFFQAHYSRLYVDGAAMAVRRLAYDGVDDKSRSLAQLLREFVASPGLLTADRHRELYGETVFGPDGGSERFESEWGDGSGALDVELVEQDIAALAEASDSISALADRTVAHIDKRGFDGELTYGDLD